MIEYPTGSGSQLPLRDIAKSLSERLMSIFLRDENGIRPCTGALRCSRRVRTGTI